MPDHKLMMVECGSLDEANYLCAALNSSLARFVAWSYAISIQYDTHILNNVAVPRYSAELPGHRRLAHLGRLARQAEDPTLDRLEQEIDEAAADLWGGSSQQLLDSQRSLKEVTSRA